MRRIKLRDLENKLIAKEIRREELRIEMQKWRLFCWRYNFPENLA